MPFTSNIFRRAIVPALAATALAACDGSAVFTGSPVISRVDIAHNYRPTEIWPFYGGDNALRVVGYGSPFGDPPAQVANAVVAAMQGHNGGSRVTFSAAPAPPPKPRWRVVMAINPTELNDTQDLCKLSEAPADAPLTARSQGGEVKILAAFCQGDWAATQAVGRGRNVGGLDSPAFDSLIAHLTRALFPHRNPHDDRDPRCRVFPCF